jgi:sugar/nucleoside kinase (ribokinase family)
VIVVSLGASGAMAVDRHGYAIQPAFTQRVVDTTGAGDTFNAAFLAATLERQVLAQSLRFACAAASCTVASRGARSGLPDRKRMDFLLSQSTADNAEHGSH